MAEIKVRGYANKPVVRESSKGPYLTFTLAERQKQRDGTFTKAYYNVADFHNTTLKDGDFINLEGYLKFRPYTDKTGAQRQSMDVTANAITVSPSKEPSANVGTPDPWDLNVPAEAGK